MKLIFATNLLFIGIQRMEVKRDNLHRNSIIISEISLAMLSAKVVLVHSRLKFILQHNSFIHFSIQQIKSCSLLRERIYQKPVLVVFNAWFL